MTTLAPLVVDAEHRVAAILGSERGVKSVALMGSLAKGTPTVTEDGRLASDVDAVAVVEAWSLVSFGRRQDAIQQRLTDTLGTACSVAPITLGLLRRAPRSVWFYELRQGGRTIWGTDALRTIPAFEAGAIDRDESIVVGFNYLQELARVKDAVRDRVRATKTARAVIAASDVLAVARRSYDTDMAKRIATVDSRLSTFAGPPGYADHYRAMIERAVRIRRDPRDLGSALPWDEAVRFLVTTVEVAARDLTGVADGRGAIIAACRADRDIRRVLAYAALAAARQRPFSWQRLRPGALIRLRLRLLDAMTREGHDGLDEVLGEWRSAFPAFRPL